MTKKITARLTAVSEKTTAPSKLKPAAIKTTIITTATKLTAVKLISIETKLTTKISSVRVISGPAALHSKKSDLTPNHSHPSGRQPADANTRTQTPMLK